MYWYVLKKISEFRDKAERILNTEERIGLSTVVTELERYKPINFYARHAVLHVERVLKLLSGYEEHFGKIKKRLEKGDYPPEVIADLDAVRYHIALKQEKLAVINEKLPDGIKDVKKALYVEGELSENPESARLISAKLAELRLFLAGINKRYFSLCTKGYPLEQLLLESSFFYWTELFFYRTLLVNAIATISSSLKLNTEGTYVLECLRCALESIPNPDVIAGALLILNPKSLKKGKRTLVEEVLKSVGFISEWGLECTKALNKAGHCFFFIPNNNSMYHFDYDPTQDLSGKLGDCFGQAMMLINSLTKGKILNLCPEAGLINWQLDQSIPVSSYPKKTLAMTETPVSAKSSEQSILWRDLKKVFSEELFSAGDLCAVHFTMNEHMKLHKGFSSGHCVTVAKFAVERVKGGYKYLIFEQEFGLFAVMDDVALSVIFKHILAFYAGMNYSKAKLIKYAEANEKTYDLLNILQNIGSAKIIAEEPVSLSEKSLFSFKKESLFELPISYESGATPTAGR